LFGLFRRVNEASPARAPVKQTFDRTVLSSKIGRCGRSGPSTGKAKSNETKSDKPYQEISYVYLWIREPTGAGAMLSVSQFSYCPECCDFSIYEFTSTKVRFLLHSHTPYLIITYYYHMFLLFITVRHNFCSLLSQQSCAPKKKGGGMERTFFEKSAPLYQFNRIAGLP